MKECNVCGTRFEGETYECDACYSLSMSPDDAFDEYPQIEGSACYMSHKPITRKLSEAMVTLVNKVKERLPNLDRK